MSGQLVKTRKYWHNTCVYCLRKINKDNQSKEHIIPKSRGGRMCEFNIVMACKKCNHERDNKKLDKFADIETRNHIARCVNAILLSNMVRAKKSKSTELLAYLTHNYFAVRNSFSSDVPIINPLKMCMEWRG